MQERYIFREMLSEIKELADQKGNVLTLDEVKEFFKNAHLTDEQLNMVCVYLIGEKIRVEGYEGPEKQEQTPEKEEAGAMEESDCLELYQAELEEIKGLSEEEELKCFQLASAGDPAAKSRLTEHYLKTVYDLSRTFAFGTVPRGDLIQEGNVALMLAQTHGGKAGRRDGAGAGRAGIFRKTGRLSEFPLREDPGSHGGRFKRGPGPERYGR